MILKIIEMEIQKVGRNPDPLRRAMEMYDSKLYLQRALVKYYKTSEGQTKWHKTAYDSFLGQIENRFPI